MKIAFVLTRDKYGEAERKLLHHIVEASQFADVTVILPQPNDIKQDLQRYHISFKEVKGTVGLITELQLSNYTIINLPDNKIISTLQVHIKKGLIVQTHLDYVSSPPADCSHTVITEKPLSFLQFNTPVGVVISRTIRDSHYTNTGTATQLHVSCFARDIAYFDIAVPLKLAQCFKRYKDNATITIYTSQVELIQHKLRTLHAPNNLHVTSFQDKYRTHHSTIVDCNKRSISIDSLEHLGKAHIIASAACSESLDLFKQFSIQTYHPSGSIELLRLYCTSLKKIPSLEIDTSALRTQYQSLQAHTIEGIPPSLAVANIMTTSHLLLTPSQKTYIIIPYSIYGGAEVYLWNHLQSADPREVCFVFVTPNQILQQKAQNKFQCISIPPSQLALFLKQHASHVLFYNSKAIYEMLARIKTFQPLHITEIIHSFMHWKDSMHGANRAAVDRLVVVSHAVARQWKITSPYYVLAPTIDKSIFTPTIRVKQNKKIVGTVARFSPEKNLHKVVDIAEKLDDSYQFIIIGSDGGTKKAVQNYIDSKALSSRVIIKDHREDIEKEYATFDLFLLTSTIEGTPITILEAQAMGIPVLAPNVGAISEMACTKDAIYASSETPAKIAQRIQALLNPTSAAVTLASPRSTTRNRHRGWLPTATFLPRLLNPSLKSKKFYITITTFNRPELLLMLLQDIVKEKYSHNLQVHIYDDCSSVDYSSVTSFIRSYAWIHYTRFPQNHGKANFWQLTSTMMQNAQSASFDYYVSLQDDNRLAPNFFDYCDFYWSNIADSNKLALNLVTEERSQCWGSAAPQERQFGALYIDEIFFTDCMYLCTKKALDLLHYHVQQPTKPRKQRARSGQGSGVGRNLTRRLTQYGTIYRSREALLFFQKTETVMQDFSVAEYFEDKPYEPLVSIYMPTYNCRNYIEAAIDSVLSQSYHNVEICICDDGSTDETATFIQAKYGHNRKIKYIKQSNQGIGAASSAALEMCRGEIVAQLDADDWLESSAIASVVQVYADNPSLGAVYTDFFLADETGSHTTPAPTIPGFQKDIMLARNIIHPLRTFKKIAYLQTEGFNKQLLNAVDYDIQMKLVETVDFYHLEKPLYNYRQRSTSTSHTARFQQANNTRLVIEDAIKRRGLSYDVVQLGEGSFGMKLVPKRILTTEIVGVMCTIPSRQSTAQMVLHNILPQVDRLLIYPDKYDQLPTWMTAHSKIQIIDTAAYPGFRDAAKLIPLLHRQQFNILDTSLYVTFDDDIKYPADYIKKLRLHLEANNYQVIVGVHGSILNSQVPKYSSGRTVFHFNHLLQNNTYVDILGTGTVAFHSSLIHSLSADALCAGMVDISFACFAKRHKLPMLCIQRPAGWLHGFTTHENTLYDEMCSDATTHDQLIASAGLVWGIPNLLTREIK